jgi:hypothetical protein
LSKRVDANQPEIVAALRKAGAQVIDLHEVGRGCPDILVAFRGVLYLMEIKSWRGGFTKPEKEWWNKWTVDGTACVVRSVNDALSVIGAI